MDYKLPFLKARASLANRKVITMSQGRSSDESARVGKTRTISTSGNISIQDNTKNNLHNGEIKIVLLISKNRRSGEFSLFVKKRNSIAITRRILIIIYVKGLLKDLIANGFELFYSLSRLQVKIRPLNTLIIFRTVI